MEEYSYIIIGVIVLIFNLYRKLMKKKKAQEVAMQMQMQNQQQGQSQQEQEQFEPKETRITDFLENFEEKFNGNFEDVEDDYIPRTSIVEERIYNIPDIENNMQQNNNQEQLEQDIEEHNVENNITQHNIKKNKIKINLKQAIIYNVILERKY